MGDKLGTIEPRKIADLILLGKNPEDDLANLKEVKFVIAGGKVIDPRSAAQSAGDTGNAASGTHCEGGKVADASVGPGNHSLRSPRCSASRSG